MGAYLVGWNFLKDWSQGHRELYGRGVLHRDISVQNILFGPPDAPEGRRGVLIDLDVAVRTANGVSPIATSPRIVSVSIYTCSYSY